MADEPSEFELDADIESRLRDAEAKIAALAQDYEVWAAEDLDRAKEALEEAKSKPSGREPQVKIIFGIAHDMKGQGGTFGFDLVTLAGQSLCDFIRHIPDATDAELRVIDRHLLVISMILERKIKGPGGPYASQLVSKLNGLVAASRGDLVS